MHTRRIFQEVKMSLSGISYLMRSRKIRCSAVVVAAGSGQRFGGDKMLCELLGTPILAYSLSVLQDCPYICEIVVVAGEENLVQCAEICDKYGFDKVTKVVLGGATRVESALSGACECSPESTLIAVHDGARPLVTSEVVSRVIECAASHKAAAAAIPSRDTVKLAKGRRVASTPDRDGVFCMQTPQVFDPVILKGALTNALQTDLKVYDDASAVEALGFAVYLSAGDEENIKITTPLDVKLAETILADRRERFLAERRAAQCE